MAQLKSLLWLHQFYSVHTGKVSSSHTVKFTEIFLRWRKPFSGLVTNAKLSLSLFFETYLVFLYSTSFETVLTWEKKRLQCCAICIMLGFWKLQQGSLCLKAMLEKMSVNCSCEWISMNEVPFQSRMAEQVWAQPKKRIYVFSGRKFYHWRILSGMSTSAQYLWKSERSAAAGIVLTQFLNFENKNHSNTVPQPFFCCWIRYYDYQWKWVACSSHANF